VTDSKEARKALEEKYRAKIVAKLRKEADRIEAGGSPICYAVNCDDKELHQDVDEALNVAAIDPPMPCDEWWDGVENHEWGVMVSVEECVRVSHRADLSGRFTEAINYELKDPDDAGDPEILSQDCPECEEEVEVPPGGRCPVCEAKESEVDDGPGN
jgi:hypothetical protein